MNLTTNFLTVLKVLNVLNAIAFLLPLYQPTTLSWGHKFTFAINVNITLYTQKKSTHKNSKNTYGSYNE
jgi:hypothetical protein